MGVVVERKEKTQAVGNFDITLKRTFYNDELVYGAVHVRIKSRSDEVSVDGFHFYRKPEPLDINTLALFAKEADKLFDLNSIESNNSIEVILWLTWPRDSLKVFKQVAKHLALAKMQAETV